MSDHIEKLSSFNHIKRYIFETIHHSTFQSIEFEKDKSRASYPRVVSCPALFIYLFVLSIRTYFFFLDFARLSSHKTNSIPANEVEPN